MHLGAAPRNVCSTMRGLFYPSPPTRRCALTSAPQPLSCGLPNWGEPQPAIWPCSGLGALGTSAPPWSSPVCTRLLAALAGFAGCFPAIAAPTRVTAP